jgi:AraC family transcriptional regulator
MMKRYGLETRVARLSLPAVEHARLKELSNTEPAGLLQICADIDPNYTEAAN